MITRDTGWNRRTLDDWSLASLFKFAVADYPNQRRAVRVPTATGSVCKNLTWAHPPLSPRIFLCLIVAASSSYGSRSKLLSAPKRRAHWESSHEMRSPKRH